MKHFPEVLEKKLIGPLTKIELHTKALKVMTLGIRTAEDYILLYLLRNKKVILDKELIETMLRGIQYKNQDVIHFVDNEMSIGREPKDINTDLPQYQHRFIDKYKNLDYRGQDLKRQWNRRFEPENSILDLLNMKTFDNIGNYRKNSLLSLQ